VLLDADGGRQGEIGLGFNIDEAGDVEPHEEVSVAFVVNLHNAAIPTPGSYTFECLIDGVHQRSLPFKAQEVLAP
jgi:hypothetical protein